MRTSLIARTRERLQQGIAAAERRGASAAKIHFGHGESIDCEFESGRLKSAGSREDVSYSIFVVVDGRSGVTSGNRLQDMELMVDRAVDLAKAGSAAHFDHYPAPADHARVAMHSERTLHLSRDRMIETCAGMVKTLKDLDGELDISASAGRSESESIMATSGGVLYESQHTGWYLGAGIQKTRGTDMLFAHDGRFWNDLNEFYDPDTITSHIGRDLEWASRQAETPTGMVPVYLPPRTLSMLISHVLGGLNGRNVAKGISPLRDHLGEDYFDANLTVVDRPHIDFCPGAAEVDSAGIPTRPCTVIEKGVIRMFLYDLDSAGLAGAEPTGHSGCSVYAPEILPGTQPSDELLAGIEDGIYLKSLLGFGQSNIANGDFSCNVALGYRIRNGEICGRIKNAMVAGNLFEIFRRDVVLSSDRDPQLRFPHAVVRGMTVHGADA